MLLGLGLCGAGAGIHNSQVAGAFATSGIFGFLGGFLLLIVGIAWLVMRPSSKARNDEINAKIP
jgi:flagellar biogenesis protein FliO